MDKQKLSNNALAVMALASEYCRAMELAASTERRDFIDKMIHLLPRIYMAVTDIPAAEFEEPDYAFGAAHLDESYYDQVSRSVAELLGADDTYLETFHQDMKYSESPVAATISEGLADIFQVMYNFIEDVRDANFEIISEHLSALRCDFSEYWSQILCNVMRPLNELYQTRLSEDDSDEMPFE
ncbi:MAG: DUF5063 domain-containing protein [Bacteroides sp.]|nr:DUF5063 domain-containing protein [Bacteroides sp.]MCM1379864.1 DUF5063 domain-containing protein [Bacteroides sp.]MCM1446104.1 DUF5063 domain-containing protein [Prevotella sp.]